MLSILTQLASSDDPSKLAEILLTHNQEPSNPASSTSILFFSESWRSETYQEVMQYMPILIRGLALSEIIKYQWLRTFLKDQRPGLFTRAPRFIGYNQFETWLKTQGKELILPSTSTSPKKGKAAPSFMTMLENACRSLMFYNDLYKELCVLAPYGRYSQRKNSYIKTENSFFQLDANSHVKLSIEYVLQKYRIWMLENNMFDPALSDLAPINHTGSSVARITQYSHVVWDGTTEISPNIFYYLSTITASFIICMPGSIKIAENVHFALQSSSPEAWLTMQHQKIYGAGASAEKTKSAKKLISVLLQIKDIYLENFVRQSMHHDRYLALMSVVICADLNQPQEVQLIKKVLGSLGDNFEKIAFPPRSDNDFYDMISRVLNGLAEKQKEIEEKKCAVEIRDLIFSLAILLATLLLAVNSHHYALYRKLFRIFECSIIKSSRELTEISMIFSKMHNEIFMKTTVSINLPETDIIKTWDIMRDTYSALILVSAQAKEFFEAFRVPIQAYNALKQHCAKFRVNNRSEHTDWHAANYANVVINFIAELNLADEKQEAISSDFFNLAFRFFSENSINNQWPSDCQIQILSNYTQFFISSVKYYINRSELKRLFPWEEMRCLFSAPGFRFSLRDTIIKTMLAFIDSVHTSSDIVSTLVDEMPRLLEIGEMLYKFAHVKSRITANEYAFYGQAREALSLTQNSSVAQANKA